MKDYLLIKDKIKEPNAQLQKLNIFKSNVFNLKKIKDNFDEINNCFNYYFQFLIGLNQSTNTELIDNSMLLLSELKQTNKELTNIYLSENIESNLKLNEYNILITDNPIKCKELIFNIKNYYIDNYYTFKLTIDLIDEQNQFSQITTNIYPAMYAGNYKELIKFNEDNQFISLFNVASNSLISVYNIRDNNKIDVKYKLNDTGHIVINKEDCFEDCYLEYNLTKEANTIPIKGKILKLYLNTNYKEKNLKYFNMVKHNEL